MKYQLITPARALEYRSEIDGVRALAIIAVMLFHGGFSLFSGGFVGVDIFFVISGYLITRILWRDMATGAFSLRDFYERRARRILPALFAMGALSSAVAWVVLSPAALEEYGQHVAATALFGSNVVYWLQASYFSTEAEFLPLFHTWSLAVEEQYYLLFPLFLALLTKAKRKFVIRALLGVFVVSLLYAYFLSRSPLHAGAAFFLLPTRMWEFAAGALVALTEADRVAAVQRNGALFARLAEAGLGLCLLSIFLFNAKTPHPGLYTLAPVAGASLLLAFGTQETPIGRILAAKPVAAIGLVSYSAYLYHQPILAFSRIFLARALTPAEVALALVAALLIGAASWRWVERPFRAPGKVSAAAIAALSATGVVSLCAIGGLLVFSKGAPERMDPRVAATFDRIKQGAKERSKGIRLGRCQYNKDVVPNLQKFLDSWDCVPSGAPRVVVVGDSMAADKSWALRLAGFDVGNLGGAACPVTPAPDEQDPCWRIMTKARALLREKKVDGIVLAQAWGRPLPEHERSRLIEFWGESRANILVFSGMPVFKYFRHRVLHHLRAGLDLESISYDPEEFSAHERSLAPLARAGFTVVNSRDLLCGQRTRCGAFRDGEPLVGDNIHLQPAGARAMAESLKQDGDWLRWYNGLR